ncbi:hypothetical protein LH716_004265 [Vibrio vulnificus]|nr:hypothetical protein [Vibrio vulnificus]EIO4061379.1 hypothetical protein [Vibrio vulnificus]EIU7061442.1 hypothetical protein [Vibrio vulnificus]MCU8142095.1 hypothetical protein [Vibrio vulnificus]HAS8484082.1 hypothetical protein [Vibrio vulnificus]
MYIKKLNSIRSLIRYYLISYFAKHLDDESNKFRFLPRYRVELFIANDTRLESYQFIREDLVKYSNVKLRFTPSSSTVRGGVRLLKGKDSGSFPKKECLLSYDHLAFIKVSIGIVLNNWSDHDNTYSTIKLFKYFLYRKLGIFYFSILKSKLKVIKNKLFNKVRPVDVVKSKYEIFQAIFSNDYFVNYGSFDRKDLVDLLYPNKEYRGVISRSAISSSVNLVVESCVESGEFKIINKDRPNERIKVTGKGINFFTETKESYKKDASLFELQSSQTKTQRSVAWLTFVLAIATTLSLVDKIELIEYWWNYFWCYFGA